MGSFYVAGLDLGQARDFTALAILQVTPAVTEHKVYSPLPTTVSHDDLPVTQALLHLERYALGTPYPAIVKHVAETLGRVPGGALLAIDATGVGAAVVDLFLDLDVPHFAITLTGGMEVHGEGRYWNVPKRDVVHGLLVALQEERFRYAASLALAKPLVEELTGFEMKINLRGHDSYEAWREGVHDDLVLAVSLAAWLAEREVATRSMRAMEELMNRELNLEFEQRISPV